MVGTAFLAGVVGLGSLLFGSDPEAERQAAVATAKRIVNAASDWKKDHSNLGCPTMSQLIVDRSWSSTEEAGDPWGGRFRIRCSSEEVSVHSAGNDGRFETDDDIAVDAPWNS